jgi:prevent-host-death family protein
MITVNMHEAKSRLSELVQAVEVRQETVVLCRNGKAAARLVPIEKSKLRRNRLKPHPQLSKIVIAYDPMEPLQPDEWPEELR